MKKYLTLILLSLCLPLVSLAAPNVYRNYEYGYSIAIPSGLQINDGGNPIAWEKDRINGATIQSRQMTALIKPILPLCDGCGNPDGERIMTIMVDKLTPAQKIESLRQNINGTIKASVVNIGKKNFTELEIKGRFGGEGETVCPDGSVDGTLLRRSYLYRANNLTYVVGIDTCRGESVLLQRRGYLAGLNFFKPRTIGREIGYLTKIEKKNGKTYLLTDLLTYNSYNPENDRLENASAKIWRYEIDTSKLEIYTKNHLNGTVSIIGPSFNRLKNETKGQLAWIELTGNKVVKLFIVKEN